MKKICIILAAGFEEIEALTVVDNVRRAGIEITMASLGEIPLVEGSHGIHVMADTTLENVNVTDYDMLVLPGGGKGTENLAAAPQVKEALDEMREHDRYIAAICAAPSVLGKYGLLEGKTACCYPGFEDKLTGANVVYENTVRDGKIITGRAMGAAMDFSLKIIETLEGKAAADKVAAGILYKSGTEQ